MPDITVDAHVDSFMANAMSASNKTTLKSRLEAEDAGIARSTTFVNGQNFTGETLQIYGDIPYGWQSFNGGAVGLVIGTSCVNIGDYAFEFSNISGTVVIPKSVLNIGEGSFGSCISLTEVVLQEPLETIGNYCFAGSGLTGTLVIPPSVTSIGVGAFFYCTALTAVDCYVTRDIMNVPFALDGTGVTTIAARASDSTWTAGADTIGGKAVTVVKNL